MVLKQPIQNVFVQLNETLNQLSDAEYIQTSKAIQNYFLHCLIHDIAKIYT